MGQRRVYNERDQARVAVLLQGNEGNIKRTVRESGVPISTVRDWKQKWEREGYPEKLLAVLPEVREDVTGRLREAVKLGVELVISELEAGKVRAKDAAWITGVYMDKIRLIEGQPTSRTETVHALPVASDDLRAQLRGFLVEIVEAADSRQADLIDAGLVEEAEFTEVELAALPVSDLKE